MLALPALVSDCGDHRCDGGKWRRMWPQPTTAARDSTSPEFALRLGVGQEPGLAKAAGMQRLRTGGRGSDLSPRCPPSRALACGLQWQCRCPGGDRWKQRRADDPWVHETPRVNYNAT